MRVKSINIKMGIVDVDLEDSSNPTVISFRFVEIEDIWRYIQREKNKGIFENSFEG
jgi:hypothetical protein